MKNAMNMEKRDYEAAKKQMSPTRQEPNERIDLANDLKKHLKR